MYLQSARTNITALLLLIFTSLAWPGAMASAQSTISGAITPSSVSSGATVALTAKISGKVVTIATTTVATSGIYSFSGIANGFYRVSPSEAGVSFSPTSQSVHVKGASVGSVNFTATSTVTTSTVTTWNISGTISPATDGAGSTVTLSGAQAASTTADANGNYTFAGLANGSYTVTPSKTAYTFSPTSSNITVNGASITGTNFTASATSSSHSVDLSWTASTTTTVSGYKVYRSSLSGGPYTSLDTNPVTSTIFTDLNVAAGSTYYYVVTAVDSAGTESSYSNQATAVVPTP